MPGSAISAVTHSSAGSIGSRRGKTRNYRVVSHTSEVDESLFASPEKNAGQQPGTETDWRDNSLEMMARERSMNKKSKSKSKKESVQVITKDLIRNLIVPTDDPSGVSVVLSGMDFMRIKDACCILTQAEKDDMFEMKKKDKEELQKACQESKNFMKTMDINRKKNQKLNDLEEEAARKATHLLEKANLQRQEQDDEIKHLNELILNAKCHAIRDAQILEKTQIKGELIGEEKRLDTMMEVDRVNAIRIQEEIERQRKDEKLHGAAKVLEQIQDNEQELLLELERKDQENMQMQKYLEKLMEEDRDKLEKKRVEQCVLREELNQANDAIMERRVLKSEQEKLAELKVLEYQKKKAERELAFEQEQEKIRIEKEKETARLRALQERARDEQAERDAIRAKRAQEQTEREWRKKEAVAARQKAETETHLKVARAQQMEQKEHFLAVQAQRDRQEFERVLRAQKELVEKDKRNEEEKKSQKFKHADDVRDQIRKKEEHHVSARNAFFEEGVKLDEEARNRRQKLDEIKQKKLNELRNAGVPAKYLSQVERKINQPQNISA